MSGTRLVLATLAVMLAPWLASGARPAAAGPAEVSADRWEVMFASFTSTDPVACVVTTLPIVAGISHTDRGDAAVFLDVDDLVRRDCETGEGLASGYACALDAEARVNRRLDGATLRATLAFPSLGGEAGCAAQPGAGSLRINLTWTGSGDLVRRPDHYNCRGDCPTLGDIANGHTLTLLRPAVATGTVTLDGTPLRFGSWGTNLTPEPSVDAFIAAGRGGQVIVDK